MPAPVRPNSYRVDGRVAYVDVGTEAMPGAVTVVDAADLTIILDGVGRWYAWQSRGRPQIYVRRSITLTRGKDGEQGYEFLHRLLARTAVRPIVLHRDYDGLNNRRSNLIACTRKSMAAHARHSKSKMRGAFKSGSRWKALIGVDGALLRLGVFATKAEAGRAYDAAAHKHFGEFARLNFPREGN